MPTRIGSVTLDVEAPPGLVRLLTEVRSELLRNDVWYDPRWHLKIRLVKNTQHGGKGAYVSCSGRDGYVLPPARTSKLAIVAELLRRLARALMKRPNMIAGLPV